MQSCSNINRAFGLAVVRCATSVLVVGARARKFRRIALLLVAGCLLPTVESACAQQSSGKVDFPAFDEIMPDPARPRSDSKTSLPETSRSNRTNFDDVSGGGNPFSRTEVVRGRTKADTISRSRTLDERFGESGSVSGRSNLIGPPGSGGIDPGNDDFPEFDLDRLRSGIERKRALPAEMIPGMQMPQTEQPIDAISGFDWSRRSTSVADLSFASSTKLLHNQDFFVSREEELAYFDLIAAADRQWRLLLQKNVVDQDPEKSPTAIWEEAFYRFEEAQRLAWNNGKLREGPTAKTDNGLQDPLSLDPFRPATKDTEYRLLDDIARFPNDYVGRPIVLYGRFTPGGGVRLLPPDPSASASQFRRQTIGDPYDVAGTNIPRFADRTFGDEQRDLPPVAKEQRLLRGTLSALTGTQQLAMVDTKGLVTPGSGLLGIHEEWRAERDIPVLVKGWVVKHWKNSRPLIYCESLRLISPRPHAELIRNSTVDKRRLRSEETWLYYETLRQLELTSGRLQRDIAATTLQQRIDALMREIMEQARIDLVKISDELKAGAITEETHRKKRAGLQRRLDQRLERHKTYRKHPEKFQTYVDMFQHPEAWQGELVTLSGHVRHVVRYTGDKTLFKGPKLHEGRKLHELWLFTDDSQHNPAVIVTPDLPTDFPMNAEVIDGVTVTGCFFKRYVYGSQDTNRIAPLILARRIGWQPTVDQIQALVADGKMSAGSPRAVRAKAIAGVNTGQAAMIVAAFFVTLTLMILWGRVGEERDRVHLRKMVNEVPAFENPVDDGYASLLTDSSLGSSNEYL